MLLLHIVLVELLEGMRGTISHCRSQVKIYGEAYKIGGIVGESIGGKIEYCINEDSISGGQYAGGICGYSNNTFIDACGNRENAYIETTLGYTGGIVGYVGSGDGVSEYAVGRCYNYGMVETSYLIADPTKTKGIATGGIVGGAWNEEGQLIVIQGCYNMGTVKSLADTIGGILGGTYSLFDETNTSKDKNSIIGCYNLGIIDSEQANQISSKYANVTRSYYVTSNQNISGYGIPRKEPEFKANSSISVWRVLETALPGYWVLNENNNGYVSLSWQNE